jgi:hypothetical protein
MPNNAGNRANRLRTVVRLQPEKWGIFVQNPWFGTIEAGRLKGTITSGGKHVSVAM